jgi:hypothetical protein
MTIIIVTDTTITQITMEIIRIITIGIITTIITITMTIGIDRNRIVADSRMISATMEIILTPPLTTMLREVQRHL